MNCVNKGLVPKIVYTTYNNFVDSFILNDFGVPCTLLFPTQKTQCLNCYYDSQNNRSSNSYNGTGPQPFTFGVCPWCNGVGFKEIPVTKKIQLRIYFHRKNWIKISEMINVPDGAVQTIGFLTDLPSILQAKQIIINSDQVGYTQSLYELHGEPVTSGFGNDRYIAAIWKRSS